MTENSLDMLDLQAPNLTEIEVEAHLDSLLSLIPALESNALTIENEEDSISLLFYIDIFKKYLLYLKDTFTATSINSIGKIMYVSENLYKQYKMINFVQQTFAIIKPLYNALLKDRFTNAVARILNYDISDLSLGAPTSSSTTPNKPSSGGGGGAKYFADINSIITR
jgi:hypothetical protein